MPQPAPQTYLSLQPVAKGRNTSVICAAEELPCFKNGFGINSTLSPEELCIPKTTKPIKGFSPHLLPKPASLHMQFWDQGKETVNLHYSPAVSSLWLEKPIWTKPNIGLLLPPTEDRREVGQAPPEARDLKQAELLGFPVSILAAFQSCLQACSSGCHSCQHTRQRSLKWHLKSDSSTSSTLCFAPYVTLLPLPFFLSAFIINTYIRTCPSLGKGSFCLVVSDCCQTAKTQNKPSQRREPGPLLAAGTITAIC